MYLNNFPIPPIIPHKVMTIYPMGSAQGRRSDRNTMAILFHKMFQHKSNDFMSLFKLAPVIIYVFLLYFKVSSTKIFFMSAKSKHSNWK